MKEPYVLMNERVFEAIVKGAEGCDLKKCETITIAFWHMVDGKWVHCGQSLDRKSKVVTFWSGGKEQGKAQMEGCHYVDCKKNCKRQGVLP